MKWTAFVLLMLVIIAMVLRFLRHLDDRAVASKWTTLVACSTLNPENFDTRRLDGLPPLAQQFFEVSIRNGTPLNTVVELTMHGEFSLGDKKEPNYLPMKARQLIAPAAGFIWQVKAGKGMMQISGSDAAYPGGSWTRFWLFGIVPVARFGGTVDHARSSFGRYMGEVIFWSPASLLPSDSVIWTEIDAHTVRVSVTQGDLEQAYDLTIDADGHLEQVRFERWSNANDDKTYRFQPFGGYLSDFQDFNGFLLPTSVTAGNHFGTDEYFPFFKVKVDSIKFISESNSERTCLTDG